MKNLTILVITILALLMVACDSNSGDASIDGEWQLLTLNGDAVLADYPVTLKIEDGRATGHSGCNTYNADITLDGDAVSFGPVERTEMACADEDGMQQENDLFAAFPEVSKYEMSDSGELLFIDDAGTTLLVFE